jgi:hypothetical protein
MKFAAILLIAGVCSTTAWGGAYAHGPVGGSETPGDPALLVTFPPPAAQLTASPPSASAPAAEPTNATDPVEEKAQPRPERKDG